MDLDKLDQLPMWVYWVAFPIIIIIIGFDFTVPVILTFATIIGILYVFIIEPLDKKKRQKAIKQNNP